MKISVSRKAREDLRDAHRWVARDNPQAADRMLVRILNVMDLLASGVVVGRSVRLRDGRKVRTWAVPPYRIYYRRTPNVLSIVRIYHQARQPIEQ
jgi:toxin ParE1/3/4